MKVVYLGVLVDAEPMGSGDNIFYQIGREFIPVSMISLPAATPEPKAEARTEKAKTAKPPAVSGDADPPAGGGTLSEPVPDPRKK